MICKKDNLLIQRLGKELFIRSEKTGNNVFLNETATQIFDLIDDNSSIELITNSLRDIYDSVPEDIENKVLAIINTLENEEIICGK